MYFRGSSIRLFVLVFCMTVYVCIGALVFILLEGQAEDVVRTKLRIHRREFLYNHSSCLSGNIRFLINLSRAHLHIKHLIASVASGHTLVLLLLLNDAFRSAENINLGGNLTELRSHESVPGSQSAFLSLRDT